MIHRHLDYPAGTPLADLGPAALDDLLERGDLADWAPLAAAIAAEPSGDLATTVERLCDAQPLYGTSPLWRAFIERARLRTEVQPALVAADLGGLRRSQGVTQTELAGRLGMTQSDLSKLERRSDMRLSTLRAYVASLAGRLVVVAEVGASRIELVPGAGTSPSLRSDAGPSGRPDEG